MPHLSTGWIAAASVAILFAILYPLVLALIAHQRLKVSWNYFLYGIVIFFLFQVISRIPLVTVAQIALAKPLKESVGFQWVWLVILVVTAGLFEEVGRYVGYRTFMRREEKTWNKAVMYGLGHGGLESILLVGLGGAANLITLIALTTKPLSGLPSGQRAAVANLLATAAAQPGWFPLLGAWERLWTLPAHVALSVLVLQVFRRHNIGWLWLAIAGHALLDGASVGLLQVLPKGLSAYLIVEGVVALFGLLAIWIIFRLRDRPDMAGDATSGVARPATPALT
jgi:uncharacterized membrane protein YhfC